MPRVRWLISKSRVADRTVPRPVTASSLKSSLDLSIARNEPGMRNSTCFMPAEIGSSGLNGRGVSCAVRPSSMNTHSFGKSPNLAIGIEILPDDLVAVHFDVEQLPQLIDVALWLGRGAACRTCRPAAASAGWCRPPPGTAGPRITDLQKWPSAGPISRHSRNSPSPPATGQRAARRRARRSDR